MEISNITFTGKLFLRDEHIQTQLFTQSFSEKVVTVKMESIFNRAKEKDFKQVCTFIISPEGYVRVQIDFKGNGKESSVRLRKIDETKLEVYHNSSFKETIEIDRNEIVLLDGLNPLFDYYNYMYFVSSEDGVNIEKDVYYIKHLEGNLIKKKYTFEKKYNEIFIKKGVNGEDVLIELWDESYNIKKIITMDSVYFFNQRI